MNTIREIQKLNQRELENVVPPTASWHTDYRDTAYVHIGGLSFDLTEGDIMAIFSQYGEPTWLKLARDKETGKSRGFGWLKYEDQRSCDLAVDNIGGATILGRVVKVDHTRYKKSEKDDDDDEIYNIRFEAKEENGRSPKRKRGSGPESEDERPLLKEEVELAKLIQEHDDDDPMKAYLIQEKKEEVAEALALQAKTGKGAKGKESRQRHRHRSRKDRDYENDDRKHSRKHGRRDEDGSRLIEAGHGRKRHGSRERRNEGSDREDRRRSRHESEERELHKGRDRDSYGDRERHRKRDRIEDHDKDLDHRRRD